MIFPNRWTSKSCFKRLFRHFSLIYRISKYNLLIASKQVFVRLISLYICNWLGKTANTTGLYPRWRWNFWRLKWWRGRIESAMNRFSEARKCGPYKINSSGQIRRHENRISNANRKLSPANAFCKVALSRWKCVFKRFFSTVHGKGGKSPGGGEAFFVTPVTTVLVRAHVLCGSRTNEREVVNNSFGRVQSKRMACQNPALNQRQAFPLLRTGG